MTDAEKDAMVERLALVHDIMNQLLREEIIIKEFPLKECAQSFTIAHDISAWALGLPCGENFQERMQALLSIIKDEGYELKRNGVDHDPQEVIKRVPEVVSSEPQIVINERTELHPEQRMIHDTGFKN